MDRDQLVMGVAGVFAGITALLTVVGVAEQPLLLLLVPPFAATAYFMWYHASGRLAARIRRRRAGVGSDPFEGFGAGARRADANFGGGPSWTQTRTGGRSGTGGQPGHDVRSGPTRAEAYRTLGIDPGASDEAVRRAYRSRVKEVHPDTDSGDEESFKRVTRAYERLTQ